MVCSIYSCRIISATVLGYLEFRRFGVNTDILFDGLLYCVPLAIIGARLWFVIFNLDDYNSIGEMFAIWNGGLAIHGGVILHSSLCITFPNIKVSFCGS